MPREEISDRLSERLRSLTSDMKRYVEKRVELLMLNAGEHMGDWIAWGIQRMTGIMLLIGGVVFLLIALAIWLGSLLGNPSLGYVLVSLPLLVLGGLILYFQPRSLLKRIRQQFENELLRALYDRPEEKGEHQQRLPAENNPDT